MNANTTYLVNIIDIEEERLYKLVNIKMEPPCEISTSFHSFIVKDERDLGIATGSKSEELQGEQSTSDNLSNLSTTESCLKKVIENFGRSLFTTDFFTEVDAEETCLNRAFDKNEEFSEEVASRNELIVFNNKTKPCCSDSYNPLQIYKERETHKSADLSLSETSQSMLFNSQYNPKVEISLKSKICENKKMKLHKRIHTGDKPYPCNFCKQTFNQLSQLKYHERRHTGDKPYSCKLCERTFCYSSGLRYHEIIHTGDKPYSCSFCGKKFMQKGSLKSHERSHTGEKPFSCSFCKESFSRSYSLKCHERLHTGKKPYSCSFCETKFNHIGNLKGHERLHTGEKPYSCNLCKKTFRWSYSLKCHERLHTAIV